MIDDPVSSNHESLLMEKIKKEVEVVSAVYDIFDKVKSENNLMPVIEPLKAVISGEIFFALDKLDFSVTAVELADLKRQVIMNSYIFKENFKVICNILGEFISRVDLERTDQTRLSRTKCAESTSKTSVFEIRRNS